MLSPSNSDDLPDVAHVLASQNSLPQNQAKRKRRPTSPRHSSGKPPSGHRDPSSARPRKKRKIQNTKVNRRAKAASPIELTSEDEPRRRNPNPKSKLINAKNKLPLAEVIDLCSDTEDAPPPPWPTRKSKGSQGRAPPPREDIIVLLSSDNDDPGPSPLPDHTTLPSGVHHPPQQAEAQQLSVKRMRQEGEEEREGALINAKKQFLQQEEEEEASNHASETNICPPPRKRSRGPSDLLSPVPTAQSQRMPTPRASPTQSQRPWRPLVSLSLVPIEESRRRSTPQVPVEQSLSPVLLPSSHHEAELDHLPGSEELTTRGQLSSSPSSEAEEPTEPLQSMYNDLFRKTPDPEDDFTPCSAFPFKIPLPPHPATISLDFEPFDMDSTPPPLLTPSFFERARQVLPPPPPKSRTTAPIPLQSASRTASGQSEATISNSESTLSSETKSRASSPDQYEVTPETKATQTSDIELLEVPTTLSSAAKVVTEVAFVRSRRSNPQDHPYQDRPQVASVVEGAVLADSVSIMDSTLESTPPQNVQSTPPSSTETPSPQAGNIVIEEVLTGSIPEPTAPLDEVTPQVTSSQVFNGSRPQNPLISSVLDQPEPVLINVAEVVFNDNASTHESGQQVVFEVPPTAQPEVLVTAEVRLKSASTSLSITLPPQPLPPVLISSVRPETTTARKPQVPLSLLSALSLEPKSKEMIPQILYVPPVISADITLSSPYPPSTLQMDTSPVGMDGASDVLISRLRSSGSDSTNDNDMQEIADMLLTKSSSSSSDPAESEPTDEELLAIGLLYPDDDEWC